ncbi:MAG: DNA polymerase III subunit gamma/tau [Candidatus Cloacimonetes bacterium]|nr:DNA polymerase III subunit gamma/tau [Candidatus Cloacimonadota bacterium]
MSYLVLARKYRPQTFEEVYAQDQITQILKNSIEMERIAHAYLFCGPRGVGKTSMARIFAKSLNCLEENLSDRPCNKCTNCLEITQGSSQDVIEIDGASNTGVEDIRDLQKELMYSTSNSRYKIYIIDEVHMLSKNAFNALLKTLEEPPDKVIFIFATTEPHKVLPTIISRCQRFDFKRIPIKKIVARMQDICLKENIIISEDSLFQLAKMADGSMRDSQSLLDQVLAYGSNEISLEDILEIFGTVAVEVYETILRSIHERETSVIISSLHEVLEKGTDLQEFLGGLMEYVRNLTLLKIGIIPSEAAPRELEQMKALAGLFNEKELIYLVSMLIRTKVDIKSSNNPVLLTEMAFIKLSHIAEMRSLEEIIGKIDASQLNGGNQANPPARKPVKKLSPLEEARQYQQQQEAELHKKVQEEKQKSEEQSQKAKELFNDLDLEKLKKYLPPLAKTIMREKMVIGKELESDKLTGFHNNVISMEIDKNITFSIMTKNQEWLEEKFRAYFGHPIRFNFILKVAERVKTLKNPSVYDIELKSPELAKNLKKIDPNMQITTMINNEY